jgi:hypothetical protein
MKHRSLSSATPSKPGAGAAGGLRGKFKGSSLSRPGTQRLRVDVGATQQDEDKEAIDALKLLSSGYGEEGFNDTL